MRRILLLVALAAGAPAPAQESLTTSHTVTLSQLFAPEETAALAKTLPADRAVTYRVRLPPGADSPGVLVFISPSNSGELPTWWTPVLDQRQLAWIAADGFGNPQPAAQRVLVALMATKLAARLLPKARRNYVAGFSGGGRVASRCATQFARYFDGAVFIAGADFVKPVEPAYTLMKSRRLVFITGSGDFNRKEMKGVYGRYVKAGVVNSLLMDEPGLGHELPNATQLTRALNFLDGR